MNMKQIREETTTVRIYGKTLKTWWINRETGEIILTGGWKDQKARELRTSPGWHRQQIEQEYTEYRLDGSVKQTGSRDFGGPFIWTRPDKKSYWVKTWDGVSRWKNGCKSLSCWGLVETDPDTKPRDLLRVLRVIRPYCRDAAEIRLEK